MTDRRHALAAALAAAGLAFAAAPSAAQMTPSPQADAPTTPAPRADVLTPEAVLEASAIQFPAILAGLADRRAAAGEALAALGAFDLVFEAEGRDRVTGFWGGGYVDTRVKQNVRPFGGQIYGGYRVSGGEFPIYEDINFTNRAGELKIGAIFSLLRDRAIDARRFALQDTALQRDAADLELFLTRIGVQHKALNAYWRWIAAARRLEIFQRLLNIARQREAGLEEEVRQGARAEIFLTENLQNIMRRRRLVTEAERDLQRAANDLSLYYRAGDGTPITPTLSQAPPPAMVENPPEANANAAADALARRPELALLQNAFERADNRVRLARNDLLPKLDVQAEFSRDFGEIGLGGASRDSNDTILGLRFSVPLQRRAAKGRVEAARARMDAVQERRRQTRDQIEIDVANILLDLSVSRQLVAIAEQEVDNALAMQRAEQRRFSTGFSDFFLVNLREEAAADAQIRGVNADLEMHIARANYDAATVNTERLMVDADSGAAAPAYAGDR